jgi:hypothetical protein
MSQRGKQTDGVQRPRQEPVARSQTTSSPFELVQSPADYRDDTARVVRVRSGIRSKQKLLAILADKLRFPGYFGWNWDALEECLGDLSWLPPGQRVVIVHEDLPFGAGGDNRGIYLSILAAAGAAERADHPLAVVFPASVGPLIAAPCFEECGSQE